MNTVQVNFNDIIGKIKPMHAIGQPPFTGGFMAFNFTPMEYIRKANIPYSRLHDVNGSFGGNRFVDIPNIFRDFDADETDPANYDFAFTDVLLTEMAKYEIKPVFRLGVTIENQCHIKAYRIHPPKDPAKWARICEHIIRHYNEGWADGYHYGIEYWEIWNEPENGPAGKNQMWTGTPEQFYELYDVTAKHLKKCFGDTIKVGGYGASGFYGIFYHPEKYGIDYSPADTPDDRYPRSIHRVNFLYGFFEYITAHHSPIDFFSWHSYYDTKRTVILANFLDCVLEKYGFKGLETHLNEWNNAHERQWLGTSYASAGLAAMMCAMHGTSTNMCHYYDARIGAPSVYCGIFNPITLEPYCTYYSLFAFGQLYTLGQQAECICEGKNLYALAATDGAKKALLVVNDSEEEQTIAIPAAEGFTVSLIDEEHLLEKVDLEPTTLCLKGYQIALLQKEEA